MANGQNAQIYSTQQLQKKNVWRKNAVHSDNTRGKILKAGNGVENFGRVRAGTIMGANQDGTIRPAGVAPISDVTGAVVTVQTASAFYVGDVVQVFSADWATNRGNANVVAVNKTTNEVTLDVLPVGTVAGDVLRLEFGYSVVGILEDEVDTKDFTTGIEVGTDLAVTVGIEGNADGFKIFGYSFQIGLALAGGTYTWEFERISEVAGIILVA